MANIGTTTAFYKVETSLSRANSEVSKSMERLATGKQNANAGDRSSYVAMADTFRMDFVGTKAGIKGGSVVMGYLETGMRVLDAASTLLSRLQELAVLGANNTNTNADHEAINSEAEAIADEFNRLMSTSKYKGKDIFVSAAGSEYVSMGGRDAEMTFGIATITYTELYGSSNRTISGGPNDAGTFNLAHLPSDAVAAKKYGTKNDDFVAAAKYEVTSMGSMTSTDKNLIAALAEATMVVRGNAVTSIVSGNKSGRTYRRGTVVHTASAAGQAPASDTGVLVSGITMDVDVQYNRVVGQVIAHASDGGGDNYAKHLEFGTSSMAARPFMQPALNKSAPRVFQIMKRKGLIK